MEINIGKMRLKNPVILASGTCGYGSEIADYVDTSRLGAIVTKTITLHPREGNPTPRIIETPAGMLNSIGLENKGLKDFIFNKSKELACVKAKVIVSIAGHSIDEFARLTEAVAGLHFVSGIELNLSCPNIEHGMQKKNLKLTAQDRDAVNRVVSTARKRTKLALITKLSPNVTCIREIAKAAEGAGADAIAAINTLFALTVDIQTRKPHLAKGFGGLSGPAVKPVALYFVREIYNSVKIPVIGIGGIMTAQDALQFIITGASAVQVGTASFVDPYSSVKIVEGIASYLKKEKIRNISSLIGVLRV